MTERNTTSHLRLANEHLICGCQAHKGPSIWNIIELKAGGHYAKEGMELPTLVFLLVGDMTVSTASAVGQAVSGGQMFLVSASDNFYAQATTDAQVLCCSFDRDISQCNRFSFDQLQRFMLPRHAAARGGEKLTLLPIHNLLLRELEETRIALSSGLSCNHYQRLKKDLLFVLLRSFYNKEQLAALFAPMLSGDDNDFKAKVMQIYPHIKTALELMHELNMSATAFNRKFQKAFGYSARQWLIQKKKEKLFRDIVMTNITITELAYKYNFTVNYMTAFCREHFGKSPTQLRNEWNNQNEEDTI